MTAITLTQPTAETSLVPVVGVSADRNPALVYLAGLAQGSRRTMRGALDSIAKTLSGGMCDAETLPWGALRFQHTAAIRAHLAETHEPATANKMLSALRGVLRAAWQLGQMTAEDYHRAIDLKGVKGSTVAAGRELQAGELSALLSACGDDSTPAGARDGAVIAVMYAAGLRRAEVVACDLADYDPATGRLVVRGKGHKERIAYLINGASAALADWLAVRGNAPGPLFVPVNKAGRLDNRRMTAQAVWNLLEKRAAEAGVREFSPHDLRRTFVSDLLDAGADIATVAKMAGHANVQTTARYDRRPEDAKRKAAGLLHVPYRKRGLGVE